MDEQDDGQVTATIPLQRPTTDDPKAWWAYWAAQGQTWRSEPEIGIERQHYLAEHRTIVPDVEQGVYPFKDIQLSRADVEWLLATHEDGRGPVDWSDRSQRNRQGLDLRGADLRHVDLHYLPLARLQGGIDRSTWGKSTLEQRILAEIQLESASLQAAHLEGACLTRAHLERTDMGWAHLEGADLYRAHLESATLYRAYLGGASLRNAYLDTATNLSEVRLKDEELGIALFSDIHWNDVNLAVVDWKQLNMLGEEALARQSTTWDGREKMKREWLEEYLAAVRSNRQLAVALQSQGMNEDAARFAYRAQKLQRVALRLQKKFGQYFFSGFLDVLAGYGYRPGRSVIWYIVVIASFALAYHFLGGLSLWPPDALVFSILSFHGRGFFPSLSQETTLHNPLVMLEALEAIVGLLIEISFIATFTQRFFGK
jgi:uncharacterized protein YjbI with pentapeptide repeats